ncbi:MAG TPA: XdhC family protein [Candidatus Polarisedimenticolaceae bacterium]
MRDVLEALLDEMRAGRACVLATVVRASGSTPRTAGARMLVRGDGSTLGTIGGGAFEATVAADAADLLKDADGAPAVKRYVFTEHGDGALGMACGGTAEVLLERVAGGPRLVIFGCGHVGIALARLARTVGFDPVLVDDREEACAAARRALVGAVHRCDAAWSELPPIGPASFVAVVTRCHRTDRLALRSVAASGARYVGLIGSRRKKAVIFRELAEDDGIDAAWLETVRCPIGLPIGGETPDEIAVSIVAELQQERHRSR